MDPLVESFMKQYKLTAAQASALAARMRARDFTYTDTPPSGTTLEGIQRAGAEAQVQNKDIGWAQMQDPGFHGADPSLPQVFIDQRLVNDIAGEANKRQASQKSPVSTAPAPDVAKQRIAYYHGLMAKHYGGEAISAAERAYLNKVNAQMGAKK